MSLKKAFISNIIFSVATQIISIAVSLIMTLGIPKLLSLKGYGYWQLFIFYTGFIGFFQFGLSDGLYLKYGGKNFNDLNKKIIKSQLVYAILFQSFLSLCIILYVVLANIEVHRFYILIAFSVYVIIGNFITLLGFLLLSTNKIIEYSKAILVDKLSFVIILVVLYFYHTISPYSLIILFLASKLLSLLFLLPYYKDFAKVKIFQFRKSMGLIKFSVFSGIILMFSNIASTLILGVGRFIIDNKWDITTFGKVSLALSATYFFLLLISQISLSLFPVLRQLNYENQRNILIKSSDIIGIVMLGVYMLYFPLIFILQKWIPQYGESFKYLIILMPICLFEGKMQMINTTYMKSINKQKALLNINVVILAISVLLSFAAAYLFQNISFVLYSMLICLALRSIITQLYLYKFYELVPNVQIFVEVVYSVVFIFLVTYLAGNIAGIFYLVLYLLYLILIRKKGIGLLQFFFARKMFSV
jgi:O-antigen/teichoic acid export membrane protein